MTKPSWNMVNIPALQSRTGPVQGQNRVFPVYFSHTGKNLFSSPGNPVRKNTQGKPCFHCSVVRMYFGESGICITTPTNQVIFSTEAIFWLSEAYRVSDSYRVVHNGLKYFILLYSPE